MTKQEFESKYGVSYNDMLDQYAYDYITENRGEEQVYEMGMLAEFLSERDPLDIFSDALWAHQYDGKEDWEGHSTDFNMNDEWFAIDAYGHYVSMNDNERIEWYDRSIDDNYFIDWLIENGYIEGEIEE